MSENYYSKLLLSTRLRPSGSGTRTIVLESESDRARLVFSAPFRRLQQKAQVFSLEANAAVRSRLTHSIEVAQYGRFIADEIAIWLELEKFASTEECRAFVNFVETACLMHDLGNPPFGHFGESAIQAWFAQHGHSCITSALGLNEEQGQYDLQITSALSDFVEFDGNCQGLRIATRLQWNKDEFGLNLTHTALASFLKYLRSPLENNADQKEKQFCKKPGFFNTESSRVHQVWETFGYSTSNPQRFPLTYVMEAADDIAYCISDLEDSIEKGLLNERLVFRDLFTQWNELQIKTSESCEITNLLKKSAENAGTNNFTFVDFRTTLSILLTKFASEQYKDNHSDILIGKCESLLPSSSKAGKVLELLKNYCRSNVYCHESVQRVELAGYSAIQGLLKHFGKLLECSVDRFQKSLNYENNKDSIKLPIVTEKKLLALFPEKHIKVYKQKFIEITNNALFNEKDKLFNEWQIRAHLITDFISGMTDDFAIVTYQMLSGIRTS